MNAQLVRKKKDNEEESNENEYDDGLRDSAYNGIISDIIRKEMEICNDRQMRQPELLMLQSSAKSTISIDKITKFSVRPPELRYVFDKVGLYFRWCHIDKDVEVYENMEDKIKHNLWKSAWFDALNHQVRVQVAALQEIVSHCEYRLENE